MSSTREEVGLSVALFSDHEVGAGEPSFSGLAWTFMSSSGCMLEGGSSLLCTGTLLAEAGNSTQSGGVSQHSLSEREELSFSL